MQQASSKMAAAPRLRISHALCAILLVQSLGRLARCQISGELIERRAIGWRPIDPTKEIRDLPQLRQAGSGWLRLHLRTGPDLPPLMIKVYQSVASEMYLDGRLLYRFGTVSTHPDRVQAYDPRAAFSLPLSSSSRRIVGGPLTHQPDQPAPKS